MDSPDLKVTEPDLCAVYSFIVVVKCHMCVDLGHLIIQKLDRNKTKLDDSNAVDSFVCCWNLLRVLLRGAQRRRVAPVGGCSAPAAIRAHHATMNPQYQRFGRRISRL